MDNTRREEKLMLLADAASRAAAYLARDADTFPSQADLRALDGITDALSEVPLPDLSGFGLSSPTVGLDGAEDGFVTLGGDLTLTP